MSALTRMVKLATSLCVCSMLGCTIEGLPEDEAENVLEQGASSAEYQAENATSKSGCSVATNRAGYTGSGFMDFGGNGTWIEWNNVNVAAAGNYKLTFRYAVASGSRQSAVLINGANVGNVPFSASGSWTTWKTATIVKPLKAGSNTIRVLANTGSGGPNLDKMDLVVDDLCPSDPNKTEPGQCGCGVAEGSCNSGATCVNVAEGQTASLSCPAGQTIASIKFASYGTPTGACPGPFALGSCHAQSSLDKVKSSCLGKSSCSVSASNGVFGDPCGGTKKSLAVQYSCSGGSSDLCPNDPNKTAPGNCGCGVPEGTCSGGGGVTHIGTTRVYDPNGQGLTLARPSGSKVGDLLILALHRTDDDLPLKVSNWTRAAECYKRDNAYQCSLEKDCITWHNSSFCQYFSTTANEGHDLAQAIFYRAVTSNEPSSYTFNLNRDSSGHPSWAFLTALRGAATTNPVRDWATTGCDNSTASVFPSVYGEKGDMLLLSQSFDDAISQSAFGPPSGTTLFGYVTGQRQYVSAADQNSTLVNDETGFLFGQVLSSNSETGTKKTTGSGASSCKDALVSLSIRAQ